MTRLESTVNAVLERLKHELAGATWESRRQYLNQMLKCADSLALTKPCAELYEAFIADDRGSPERRRLHVYCVKMVDALAGTRCKDEQGVLFNEPPMPCEGKVQEFFSNRTFPITTGVPIETLIVKAENEMRHLQLSDSTMGQYKHSWMDIRRFFHDAGVFEYDETLLYEFIQKITDLRDKGSMNEWKWKINRKAAHVLLEVAHTGCFQWGMVSRGVNCDCPELETIRRQYLQSLVHRNFSKTTISLYDYVFRKTLEFAGVETPASLLSLSAELIQLVIIKFATVCNRRSMATILPILRSLLGYFRTVGLIRTDLTGIVMGAFVQKGSVAAYLSAVDQASLVSQLDKEPKRTKAIILLALKLGIRDCDICSLTFQAVDWHKDKIKLNQKKTGDPLVLPLLPDVGNALMEYILEERPKRTDNYPYVFLRKQAPHCKLSTVYPICSMLLKRQGIKPVNGNAQGAHVLRYSMVQRLLAAKVPHQVITDALGHTSKESDKPYVSMEEHMLRMCALDLSVIGRVSWRGGACGG